MPSSSLLRSFALLLAAGAISQQQVDAVVCEGTEDATDVSMSCGGLFNTCTSSGLCVVGTDSKCCSVNTDSKDKTSCVQKDFKDFPYKTTCDEFGVTAVCSGTEDKTDFTNSCGGLVDTCTGSGQCVVNQEGVCCSVYSDAEKESKDCVPKGDYTSTCNKDDSGVAVASTGSPTKSPTMATTKSPTPADSGCSRKDAAGLVLGSFIAFVLVSVAF